MRKTRQNKEEAVVNCVDIYKLARHWEESLTLSVMCLFIEFEGYDLSFRFKSEFFFLFFQRAHSICPFSKTYQYLTSVDFLGNPTKMLR